jgi:hypothetical protein
LSLALFLSLSKTKMALGSSEWSMKFDQKSGLPRGNPSQYSLSPIRSAYLPSGADVGCGVKTTPSNAWIKPPFSMSALAKTPFP